MKNWKIEGSISIADSWVADGFNLKQRIEEMEELLQSMLPYAEGNEIIVKIKITAAPAQVLIDALQNGETEAKD